jgi:hypothetical protein
MAVVITLALGPFAAFACSGAVGGGAPTNASADASATTAASSTAQGATSAAVGHGGSGGASATVGPGGGSVTDGSSSSSNAGGGGTGGVDGMPTLPDGRGATVPWTEYEAEDMETNGQTLGPSRTFTEVASEASGRRAVQLSNTGDYVRFTNKNAANGIVVRYSIPDGGNDYWTTLSVYVNDELRGHLAVTSRYSWTYGDSSHFNKPDQNDPGLGVPHHFFDESRALLGDVPQGATVMLRKDAGDAAAQYTIDLVDMEPVPGPIGKPDGYLSATDDCGATPNDDGDDTGALQKCIDRVYNESHAGLYLPQGEFKSLGKTLSVANITIRGAGIWYTTVSGYYARFDCWTAACKYYDFSVFGDTVERNDNSPETAFGGNGSSGMVLDSIWIEHTKVGCWSGPNTDGLSIKNARLRDLFADGVNLSGGTKNSTVENSHARNTGDDSFASWSSMDNAPNQNNAFKHIYAQLPWKANCFGIYGGAEISIEDSVCSDVVQYPGVLIGRLFGSNPFSGTIHVDRNTLIRAGGDDYGQPHGALKLYAYEGALQNVKVSELDIFEPTYSGIHVDGPGLLDTTYFDTVTITKPGTAAFHLGQSANGAMDASNVTAMAAPTGVIDESGGNFKILPGSGNSGW